MSSCGSGACRALLERPCAYVGSTGLGLAVCGDRPHPQHHSVHRLTLSALHRRDVRPGSQLTTGIRALDLRLPLPESRPGSTVTPRPAALGVEHEEIVRSEIWLNEPLPVRQGHSLRPAVHSELREDVLNVRVDGLRAHHEPVRDLGLSEPL